MLFERIYDEDLAQAGYFIGCQRAGTAVVVDPRRDVGVYLEAAENLLGGTVGWARRGRPLE